MVETLHVNVLSCFKRINVRIDKPTCPHRSQCKIFSSPIDLILVGIYLHFYFIDLFASIYIYIKKEGVSFMKKGELKET